MSVVNANVSRPWRLMATWAVTLSLLQYLHVQRCKYFCFWDSFTIIHKCSHCTLFSYSLFVFFPCCGTNKVSSGLICEWMHASFRALMQLAAAIQLKGTTSKVLTTRSRRLFFNSRVKISEKRNWCWVFKNVFWAPGAKCHLLPLYPTAGRKKQNQGNTTWMDK